MISWDALNHVLNGKVMLDAVPLYIQRLRVIPVMRLYKQVTAYLAGFLFNRSTAYIGVEVGPAIGAPALLVRWLVSLAPISHVSRMARIAVFSLGSLWGSPAERTSRSGRVDYHNRGTLTLTRLCI